MVSATPPVRSRRLAARVIFITLGIYVVAFIARFDVLGGPVQKDKDWIGPVLRGDSCAIDFGKVYDYPCDDLFYYHVFWPLCKLWILFNGL